MKKKQRGGKREGSGRKPIPNEERCKEVFSIRITEDEKRLLDETDARKWARDILIRSARKRIK